MSLRDLIEGKRAMERLADWIGPVGLPDCPADAAPARPANQPSGTEAAMPEREQEATGPAALPSPRYAWNTGRNLHADKPPGPAAPPSMRHAYRDSNSQPRYFDPAACDPFYFEPKNVSVNGVWTMDDGLMTRTPGRNGVWLRGKIASKVRGTDRDAPPWEQYRIHWEQIGLASVVEYVDDRDLDHLPMLVNDIGLAPPETTAPEGEMPELVTLEQAAVLVNRTSSGLRHYGNRGMPRPSIKGKKGKPNEYLWSEMRPWLEDTFARKIPDVAILKFRTSK
jgi:hypothetical protein